MPPIGDIQENKKMAYIQVNCKASCIGYGIVKMVRVNIKPNEKKKERKKGRNAKDRQHCGSGIENIISGHEKGWDVAKKMG